jgi:alginate O-acetyltransferase complex protein AlgI
MIFTSLIYACFLATSILLLAFIKDLRFQKALILIASYYFYSRWDSRFVLLLAGLTLSTFVLVGKMEEATSPRARSGWLWASILVSLATLAYFKYTNFFIDSLNSLPPPFHVSLTTLQIVLPVGISFIVFEVISYAVDVYRKEAKYEKDLLDFSILVAFFPHLVAGPILKPNDFLPQLRRRMQITTHGLSSGLQIFVIGLAKKVLIANRVSPFVDLVFQHPNSFSGLTTWMAVFAYALQIYADFSGYTDMAIGSAKMMGFDIPQNFDLPYLAQNITLFWRKWHISLSTWLRNYLYFPLGGNRKGKTRTYVNLAVVMLLGGLWHGASWNFVLWGGLHGSALALHKLYLDRMKPSVKPSGLATGLGWFATFIFVLTAWVPFRSAKWDTTLTILHKLYGFSTDYQIEWNSNCLLYAVPVLLLCDWGTSQWHRNRRFHLSKFSHQVAFFFGCFMILAFSPSSSSPFIYFQF